MRMRKFTALAMTVCVAFSAAVLPVSAAEPGSAVNENISASATKKKKEIAYDHNYEIHQDTATAITFELPGLSKLGYSISDKSVLKVKKTSYKDGVAKITVVGLKEGITYLKAYDKKNKKNSSTVKITVIGDDNEYNYDSVKLKTKESEDNYAEQILELVNYERKKAGVSEMTLDKELCKAADVRAKEIGKEYSHTRPDGSSCFTILDDNKIAYSTAGENIAKGQSTCKEVMQGWMNSANHKNNILNSKFTKIGIGYDPDTDCWVQIFVG